MRDNRWYWLVGLVAILGIVGIVYWVIKSERRPGLFGSRQPITTDEL